MRVRSMRSILAAIALATTLLVPAGAQAADPLPLPFEAQVNGCGISGSGTAPGKIVHRSASGAKKATYTPQTSSLSWYASCTKPALVPGDTLTFFDLSVPGSPSVIQKVTIPAFTAVSDRTLKRVTGVSKGAKTITLQLQQCRFSFIGCDAKDDGEVFTDIDQELASRKAA